MVHMLVLQKFWLSWMRSWAATRSSLGGRKELTVSAGSSWVVMSSEWSRGVREELVGVAARSSWGGRWELMDHDELRAVAAGSCGSCVWLVCVARVCGSCVWLVCVARVCGSCVWLVCVARVWLM